MQRECKPISSLDNYIKQAWQYYRQPEFIRKYFDSHQAIKKMIEIDGNQSGTAYLDAYNGNGMSSYHGQIAIHALEVFRTEIKQGELEILRESSVSQNMVGKDSVCALWRWKV